MNLTALKNEGVLTPTIGPMTLFIDNASASANNILMPIQGGCKMLKYTDSLTVYNPTTACNNACKLENYYKFKSSDQRRWCEDYNFMQSGGGSKASIKSDICPITGGN